MTANTLACTTLFCALFWLTPAPGFTQTPTIPLEANPPGFNATPQSSDEGASVIAKWQALADMGDAAALYNLGQAHRLGRFVNIDLNKAVDFYERAARLGYIPAQLNLATLLYFAPMPIQDKALALSWWQQAAQSGDAQARYMLGILYFNGEDVPRDYARALAYLQHAQQAGLPEASESLRMIAPHVSKADRTRARGIYAQITNAPIQQNPAQTTSGAALSAPAQAVVNRAIWRVQIGSLPSQGEAEAHWQSLSPIVSKVFGSMTPIYDLSRPGWVRVQIGAFESAAAAIAACKQYQRLGKACLAIKGQQPS